MDNELMEDGCSVIVSKCDGEHSRVCELVRGRPYVIEKLSFFPDKAIGCKYGSYFEVKDRQLEPIPAATAIAAETVDEEGLDKAENGDSEGTKFTECDVQALSQEQIEKMKEKGASGGELAHHLANNNTNFKRKTSYAQDKYMKRKRRKHGDRLILERPSIRLIADIYYKKDTEKMGGMGVEMLSQVILSSEACSGSRIGVFEQVQGLLSAAVLERMSGEGALIHLHKGNAAQSIPCIKNMSFTQRQMECFHPVPLHYFASENRSKFIEDLANTSSVVNQSLKEDEQKRERRLHRQQKIRDAHIILEGKQLEAILIASKTVEPLDLLKTLMPSMKPACPIVIFSPQVQPLLHCYKYLKDSEIALDLRLIDSFYREIQVLPMRTHPEMTQLVATGYILSAVSVLSTEKNEKS